MIGYQLIERATLAPGHPNGIAALETEIGMLDFLRDLAEDDFPFPRLSTLCIVGLEEVLYAAQPDEAALAFEIKRQLQAAASLLQGRMIAVQVVFQEKLMRGDSLWVVYRGQRLPVGHIFGSPMPQTDERGNRFFRADFNLN